MRVDNITRGGKRTQKGLSLEDIEADEVFPENFAEVVSSKSFKSRKKSLLRKQIRDLQKKLENDLPMVWEVQEEIMSVSKMSQDDELGIGLSLSLEKVPERLCAQSHPVVENCTPDLPAHLVKNNLPDLPVHLLENLPV